MKCNMIDEEKGEECQQEGYERSSMGIYAGRMCDAHWEKSGYKDVGPEDFDEGYAGESLEEDY